MMCMRRLCVLYRCVCQPLAKDGGGFVPFSSPPSLAVEFTLPHRGVVKVRDNMPAVPVLGRQCVQYWTVVGLCVCAVVAS